MFSNKKKDLKTDRMIDEWDLDVFDMSEFGQSEPIPDDRNPITKAAKSLGTSAVRGAVNIRIQDLLKQALPSTYGEIFDTTDAVGETYSQALNETQERLRPLKSDLLRVGRKSLQLVDGKIPNTWLEKLKKITESEESDEYRAVDKDAALNAQLSKIFEVQYEAQMNRDRINDQKETERQFAQFKQHKDTLSQLDAIRQATQSMHAYNARINVQYQRKSLELQFRQYDVSVKTLEMLTAQYNDFKAELAGIKKNTGLPEFVKLNSSESLKEALRNKFVNSITGGDLYKKATNFLPGFLKQIREDVGRGVGSFADMGTLALMGLDAKVDMRLMEREFGEQKDPYGSAGEALGGFFREKALEKLRKYTSGSDKVNKYGNKGALVVNNLEAFLRGKLGNRDRLNEGKIKGTLLDLFEHSMNRYSNADTNLQRSGLMDLGKPAIITQRFTKSVTEIIPGYLSRILREINTLRTGQDHGLVEYDFNRNKFADQATFKKSVIDNITRNGTLTRSIQYYTDAISRRVDSKEAMISKEDRARLRPFFMKLARDGKVVINKNFLSSASSFESLGTDAASRISKAFAEYLKDDPDGSKEVEIVKTIRALPTMLGNPLAALQEMVNSGQGDYLEELGLFRKGSNSSVDVDTLTEYILGTKKPGTDITNLSPGANQPFGPKPSSPSGSGGSAQLFTSTGSVSGKPIVTSNEQLAQTIERVIQKADSQNPTKDSKLNMGSPLPQENVTGDIYVEGESSPRITEKLLKLGKYFDSATGKVIKSLTEVKGDIVDHKGFVALKFDEFEFANIRLRNIRFDPNSPYVTKPFRAVINMGLTGLAASIPFAAKSAFQLWKNTFKLSNKSVAFGAKASWWLTKNTALGISDWARGKKPFKLRTKFKDENEAKAFQATASGAMVQRLDELLNMFDDRVKDESVEGDHNGSGYRDGSVKDKLFRKKVNPNFVGPLQPKDTATVELVNLFKKFMKKQQKQMDTLIDEVDENGDIMAMQSLGGSILDMLGMGGGGRGGRGARGGASRFARFKQFLARPGVAKAMTGAKVAGAGFLGYQAYNQFQKGNTGTAAALGVGSAALTPGVGSAMGNAVGRGLAKVGITGVGSFASRALGPLATIGFGAYDGYQAYKKGDNVGVAAAAGGTGGALAGAALGATIGSVVPVVGTLIGGAIGGIGGWLAGSKLAGKAASWLKRMTNTISDYDRIRLAMYGFSDDKYADQIFQLETICNDACFEAQGQIQMNTKHLDPEAVVSAMGLDPQDQSAMHRFQVWFMNRFRLSYLAAASVLNRLNKGATVDNLDNQSDEIKNTWAKKINTFNSAYYNNMVSPFKDLDQLQLDPEETKALIKSIVEKLPETKAEKDKASETGKVLAGAGIAASAGVAAGTTIKSAHAVTEAAKVNVQAPKESSWIKDFAKGAAAMLFGGAGALFTLSATGLATKFLSKDNKLTELEAILFKTLGVGDLASDKVSGLVNLIVETDQYLNYSETVTFKGNLDELLEKAKGFLGANDGGLKTWLTERYLPVILEFALAAFNLTKTKLSKAYFADYKPADAMRVADSIKVAKSQSGTSIWTIDASPWKGYSLLTNADEINPHYISLRDKVGNSSLKAASAEETRVTSEKTKEPTMWENISNGVSNAWNSVKSFASNAANSVGNAVSNFTQGVGQTVANAGHSVQNVASGLWEGIKQGVTGKISKDKEAYRDAIWVAMQKHGITSKNEVAAFLAQIGHETGNLRYTEEIASGEKYEGRRDLGNTQPGDGVRFKGRGLIQLTGRANYQAFSKAMGRPDIMQNPSIVATDPELAVESAIYYWKTRRGLREAAQRGDIVKVSKLVNGGKNGLPERIRYFNGYLKGEGKLWKSGVNLTNTVQPQGAGKAFDQLSSDDIEKRKQAIQNSNLSTENKQKALAGLAAATGTSNSKTPFIGNSKADYQKSKGPILANSKEEYQKNAKIAYDDVGEKSGAPWMKLAHSLVGTNENNAVPLIKEMHKVAKLGGHGPSTPWCASFVSYVLENSGIASQKSARAFDYKNYGVAAPQGTFPYGAILVFNFSHVSFCAGEEGGYVLSLGGNQTSKAKGSMRNGGETTISRIGKNKVIAVRLPVGYAGGGNPGDTGASLGQQAGAAAGAAMSSALSSALKGYTYKSVSIKEYDEKWRNFKFKQDNIEKVATGTTETNRRQPTSVETLQKLAKEDKKAQKDLVSKRDKTKQDPKAKTTDIDPATGKKKAIVKAKDHTPNKPQPLGVGDKGGVNDKGRTLQVGGKATATGSLGGAYDAGRNLIVGNQTQQNRVMDPTGRTYTPAYNGQRYQTPIGSLTSLGNAYQDMKDAWTGKTRSVTATKADLAVQRQQEQQRQENYIAKSFNVLEQQLAVQKASLAVLKDMLTAIQNGKVSKPTETPSNNTARNSNSRQQPKELVQPPLNMKHQKV